MRKLLGTLSIMLFLVGPVLAQQSKPKLKVSCTAEKASLKQTDTLNLRISVENVGTSAVYVYKTIEWGWAGIRFRLTDAHGTPVALKEQLGHPPVPPPIYKKEQLVGIEPTYFYGTHAALDLGLFHLKPGVYQVQISYASNYHAQQGFGLPILTVEDGEFVSNTVQIEIRTT